MVSQDKPFLPRPLPERLAAARRLGFDGYEIDGGEILADPAACRAAVAATGVAVTSVCGGYRGWIGDFDAERRRTALEDIGRILEAAATVGAAGIVVPAAYGIFSMRLPPFTPPRGPEEDRAVLLASLARLDGKAGTTGTTVFLEPLNRYEDHMLNTLAAARALIEAGGFRHVRLTADFFHMNIEEPRMEESLRECGSLVGHVHVADSHRYQPGDGHTDFLPALRALRAAGFDGCLAFECRVLGDDPAARYAAAARHVRALWDTAAG